MTDHATASRPALDRPEIGGDANGQTPNPRYVPLPDGSLFDIAESHGLTPSERPRYDGWTADRQRRAAPLEHAHWTNFRRTFRARRDDAGVNPVPPAPAKAGVSRGFAPLAVRTRAAARPHIGSANASVRSD